MIFTTGRLVLWKVPSSRLFWLILLVGIFLLGSNWQQITTIFNSTQPKVYTVTWAAEPIEIINTVYNSDAKTTSKVETTLSSHGTGTKTFKEIKGEKINGTATLNWSITGCEFWGLLEIRYGPQQIFLNTPPDDQLLTQNCNLKEEYNQTRLKEFARQVKEMFPDFTDQIDAMVKIVSEISELARKIG